MRIVIRLAPPVALVNFINRFKRLYYRNFYSKVAKETENAAMEFMNYGYSPLDGEILDLPLPKDLELYRLSAQMYYKVVGAVDIENKDVLEVGSGRGGGTSFIYDTLKPSSLIGLDLTPRQVELCNERYARGNLHFQTGDAQNLPFKAESFDAVYNIESSHCYPDQEAFFQQVHRVLKSGGYFLYTDFRSNKAMDTLRKQLADIGFETIEYQDITPNVFESMQLDVARKQSVIDHAAKSEKRKKRYRKFAAMEGEPLYKWFENGSWQYFRMVLKKS